MKFLLSAALPSFAAGAIAATRSAMLLDKMDGSPAQASGSGSLPLFDDLDAERRFRSLEQWTAETFKTLQEEDEMPSFSGDDDAKTVMIKNLDRFVESTDALATLFSLMNKTVDHVPTILEDAIHRSMVQVNKTKEIAMAVASAIATDEEAEAYRRLSEEMYDGEDTSERTSNPHGKSKRPFEHHPRVKRRYEVHDALDRGTDGFGHRLYERYVAKQQFGSRKAARSSDRRLQETNTRLRAESDCIRLLGCVNEWTLHDLITYFWFDDITEAGEISNHTQNYDAEDIWEKAKDIQEALKAFKKGERVKDTAQFPEKCNALLRLFHQNEEFEGYSQNKAATWRDVCRAEGNTRYLQFSQIEEKMGDEVADKVFEDAIMCASNVDSTVFFNEENQPRVPTGFNSYALDRHGKVMDPTDYFDFQVLETMNSLEIPSGTVLDRSSFRNSFNSKCKDAVSGGYRKAFNSISPYYVDESTGYPPLVVSCSRSSTGNDFECRSFVGESRLDCGAVTLSRGDAPSAHSQALEFEDSHPMRGLFHKATNRDTALGMLLGERISNGLLCAHRKPPGFCCLDLPGENQGTEFWGENFQCEHGEEQCNRLGPTLSGFSEKTCQMYSGVYCAYPRDCTKLKQCISNELEWAAANNKKQYKTYLEDSPEIEDTMDQEVCGEVREYFGFEADYPDDEEICEDIELLRYNRNFDSLDAFAEAEPPEQVTAELPDATQPATAVPLPDLEPPGPTLHTADFHLHVTRTLHAFQHIVEGALEELFDMLSDRDCGCNAGCEVFKNIEVVLSGVVYFAAKRILLASQFAYEENDTLSDFNMDEIYQDVSVVFSNTEILRDGFQSIGDQNVANMQIILDRFDDAYRINNENQEQVFIQFDQVGVRLDDVDESLTELEEVFLDECTPEGARKLLQLPETAAPAIMSGTDDVKVPIIKCLPGLGYVEGNNGVYELEGRIFQTASEALTYLNRTLQVDSDCPNDKSLDVNLSVAEEKGCSLMAKAGPMCIDGWTGRSHAGSPQTIVMHVDEAPPQVSCGFHASLDPEDETKLVVQEGQGWLDAGLWINARDDCSDTLDVDVSVYSNEMEEDSMVLLRKTVSSLNSLEEPAVFLSTSRCNNGDDTRFCASKDPSNDSRVYTIDVKATDQSGRSGRASCHVKIVPESDANDAAASDLRGKNIHHFWKPEDTFGDVFVLDSISLKA